MGYQDRSLHPATPSARRPADPRMPHPSWRNALLGSGPYPALPEPDRIVDADDFWSRLGI